MFTAAIERSPRIEDSVLLYCSLMGVPCCCNGDLELSGVVRPLAGENGGIWSPDVSDSTE
ncbi:hypothetical protein C8R44DRAFT_813913 [Mycena epipterygia]|nr:hypothetical protein C8R44DRAFT_813913 [Mycena epipterygia]